MIVRRSTSEPRYFQILIFLYFSPSSIECATLKLITMSTDLLFVGTTLSSAQWRRKAQNMAPRSPDLQAHIQSSFLVRSFDLHFGHLTVSYSLNQYSVLKLLILRDDPTNQWNKFWEWHVPIRCTSAACWVKLDGSFAAGSTYLTK